MTRTDDLLNQINAAVDDWETSEDAMRCAPNGAPAEPAPDGRQAAREILTCRLIDRHGLTPTEAADAIAEAERGWDGPHTHLVRAEINAILMEATERIRAQMQPMVAALTDAFRRIAAAVKQAKHAQFELAPPPARRPDRPAWQSPYGPPQRRRR